MKKTGIAAVLLMAVLLTGSQGLTVYAEDVQYAAMVSEIKADALDQKLIITAGEQSFARTMADFANVAVVVLDQSDGTRICHIPDTAMLDQFVQEINASLAIQPADDAFYYYDEASGTFLTYPGMYAYQVNENGKAQIYQRLLETIAAKDHRDKELALGEECFDRLYLDIPEEIAAHKYVLKGSCTTSLKGSSANRIQNIQIAVSKIDQLVLYPGQEISMNTVFTPRTRANGYREAGAYLNGRTVQATGGGICQASSTIYNAAMNSGLTVLERHPHSMPVSYLPLGMDAAISSGSKDLRLRNDYPFPVLFEGYIEGKTVTVNIYTDEAQTAGVSYRLHTVRTGSLSAKTYLEVSLNGVVAEDRYIGASKYNPHLPENENEDE